MSVEPDEICEPCKEGDHINCDGETAYGEPCQCDYCEQLAMRAAQDVLPSKVPSRILT